MTTTSSAPPLRVALLGCGTVGGHVARLLTTQADQLAGLIGRPIDIVGIAVRSLDEAPPTLPRDLFTDDALGLVGRDDIDVAIELVGGIDFAGELVRTAIAHGASVVTANKALLGAQGADLFARAEAAGVDLYYEAAVAGAIPIIRPLRESLVGDEVTLVMGIVNGTTNYILDQMTNEHLGFAEALAQAQHLGFA
ncbi:MAG: homoserine dehydrogenase, partial [Actinomycetia bacterium]|nr:homoserine dehydrogenase [Actinomycetes bacterium]